MGWLMDFARTLIIGNSGSGKSWLAQRLAGHLSVPCIGLDSIHWLSDEHSIARPRGEALAMARIAASGGRWVIEGSYGWIVSELVHRATALIWLSLDDAACVANIRQREARRDENDELLMALLDFASSYRCRKDPDSFSAHQQLFSQFGGPKLQMESRSDVTRFIEKLRCPADQSFV